MDKNKFDFSGYATKNNVKCRDERVILKDAFKEQDGIVVPLVWHHMHNEPDNILGHALLENREDGVYAYGEFNDTPKGQLAKKLVTHKDIVALSIYANDLVQKGKAVIHGVIRELSLVTAGANPGALIDYVVIEHGDGTETNSEDEAIIFMNLGISLPGQKPDQKIKQKSGLKPDLEHAAGDGNSSADDKTVQEVFDSFTDEQKTVVYALIAEVADSLGGDVSAGAFDENGNFIVHKEGDNKLMKKNVFDNQEEVHGTREYLTHDQFAEIMTDAQKLGSFKTSFLEHVATYGIENIDYLFPDARTITNSPAMISRRMEWVTDVINGTNHSPFSRIKSLAADITAEDARARGYVKASLKKEEVIKLLRRVTTPKTIYKKQKLDRDDIVDITDLDVVAWMKAEMRVMLDEELARAILVSDGRPADDEDKIDEANIRPIWTDDDMYAHHIRIESDKDAADKIEAIIRAREVYNGSGSPALYTSTGFVSDMLLLKDAIGRRIYSTEAELLAVLRVSKIVEVPVMSDLTRESDDEVPVTLSLVGIVVNLKDYTLGADKGGEVSMFDDFDIDYNQFKYLLETRVSGALTLPKSAIVIEQEVAAG